MSDSAYAIKYRPKKLGDVIGQKTTIQTIANSFKSKTLHHAYILAGNLGCGKTTIARIMAATENCRKGQEDPCGECDNCKAIFSGKSLDIKELDAASNRGIDDIRDIRKEAQFSPVDCSMKYFIIDEAHRLTPAAAEAMLKIIEEPPDHVRFILCTTDPHLLVNTLHSRCIFLKFNKVNWSELFTHLLKIAKLEKLDFEEDALKIAAKSAKGSVRNALQNMQTIENYVGRENKLTYEESKEILGTPEERLFFALVDAISEIDVPKAMQTIADLVKDGKEAREILDGLELHLRNLLLILTCYKNLEPFGFMEDEVKRYKHQASNLLQSKEKVQFVLELMKMLTDVGKGLMVNLDLQILLEKYVIECIIIKRKLEKV